MIKIQLSDKQRVEIDNIMNEYINREVFQFKLKELIELLKDSNCTKTATLLEEKIQNNSLFLLHSYESFVSIKGEFEKAIGEDPVSDKNIIKLLESGHAKKEKRKNEEQDEKQNKEKICGFADLYKNFSDTDKAYKILETLGVKVCPYCNRQYTFTVKEKGKEGKEGKKARPQFDHFFAKSDYPYFALSIYNLIPSCPACNQGKNNTSYEKFLYPFEESFEDKEIFFQVSNICEKLLKQGKLDIELVSMGDHDEIIKQYNDSFKINLLYNEHSENVSELLYKNYVFNEDTIESIYHSYSELFNSQSELKQLIFGNCEPDNFNQRPLSKLTYDVMRQLNDK